MKIRLQDLVDMHKPLVHGLVIDIGGYKGEYTERVSKRFDCKVIIFEPDPELFSFLLNKFQVFPKMEIHGIAVGKPEGWRDLYLSWGRLGNSFYKEWAKSDKSVKVPVVSLVNFMRDNKIKKADILKVNCEGAEYEIMDDLIENNMLDCFNEILIQFHKTEHKSKRKALEAKLAEKFIKVHNYKIDLWQKK